MSKSGGSIILGFLFLFLLGNSIFYFVVPYENDEMIIEGDLGIVDNLKVPFHAYFWTRSQNQSIEISLTCTEGSIDIVVFNSSDWVSWYNGSEYTAYYESTNTTFVNTVIQISPQYRGMIDIVISTNYGDVAMVVSMYSHSISYDDNTAIWSLFGAVTIVLVWQYYRSRTKRTVEVSSIGAEIS